LRAHAAIDSLPCAWYSISCLNVKYLFSIFPHSLSDLSSDYSSHKWFYISNYTNKVRAWISFGLYCKLSVVHVCRMRNLDFGLALNVCSDHMQLKTDCCCTCTVCTVSTTSSGIF
jgi:hypothetical protein